MTPEALLVLHVHGTGGGQVGPPPGLPVLTTCALYVLVVILSRLVVVALFAMEGWVTRPHGAGVGLPQMLRDLGAWDGIWYRSIAASSLSVAAYSTVRMSTVTAGGPGRVPTRSTSMTS